MRQHTRPPTATFSATTSWVGVLLLGAGLTQMGLPPGQATSLGPQSASIQFSSVDEHFGVLSGGQQKDFTTGTEGWQAPAFESLGMMGMECTNTVGTHLRRDISPNSGTSSLSPGGESSWTATAYLSANVTNQIYTDKTVSLNGNQVRFAMRHRSLGDEPHTKRRLFWVAKLATGYDPAYSGAGTSSVLITDASGVHPSVILHVTTTAGTATFEGGNSLSTPLTNGDRSPTLYVIPGTSTDFTMQITVGIVDADPCSASTASSFAASQGGVFGTVWASVTSCAANATWSLTADGDESGPLSLDFGSPYVAPSPPMSRTLDIQGLPDGVTWERAEDSGTSLHLRLTGPTTVTPGTYALAWSSTNSTDNDGVTLLSRPSSGSATLTVLAAPLPEPEPEPEPQPETPVLISAPEPEPTPELEPEPEPTVATPTASDTSEEIPESLPAPVVISEPETPVLIPSQVTQTPEVPLDLSPPVETIVEQPSVLSLDRAPRSVGELGPEIPEPLGAGAWWGLGTGLLASGGIIAALRRRFTRAGDARVGTLERID